MAIDYGINSLDAGASDITYTGNEGPKSPQQEQQMQMQQQQMQQMQQMKMASLMQEYKDYVMQQEEAGRPAMPFEEWVRSMQSPMAQGGRAGYQSGTSELLYAPLVAKESEIIKVTAATANRLHVVLSALEIKPRIVTT